MSLHHQLGNSNARCVVVVVVAAAVTLLLMTSVSLFVVAVGCFVYILYFSQNRVVVPVVLTHLFV